MLDFLTPTGILSAFLSNAWTAFSPLALAGGLSGAGLLVLAFVGLSWLPAFLKRPLIFVGAALLVISAVYQAGQAKGAHDAFAKDAARALLAEKLRVLKAEKIAAALTAQAEADLAAERASSAKLKDLLDAVQKRKDAARVCLPRELSRRLRDL